MRLLISLLIASVFPLFVCPLHAQDAPGVIGWYNGDRQSGIPGRSSWYVSKDDFARLYDDFVVPPGGWTITGVFSNNSIYRDAPPVTQAAWEIRGGMSVGEGGTIFAAGVSAATQTYDARCDCYRIRVDGLNVQLAPGRYWLSVAPIGPANQQSYVAATLGANAVGDPPGNNGGALYHSPCRFAFFVAALASGSAGTSADFSQGVVISGTPQPVLTISEQWRANLVSLAQLMPVYHSLPFPGITLDEFDANATDLYNRIPAMSEPQIRTGLQKLVASIGNSQTDVRWGYPSPFHALPLSFYWFDDGLYVTEASAQYTNLLGGKLLSIGRTDINEATRILTALVPHENDQWVKNRIPRDVLANTDFLFGMGLIDGIDSARLEIQTPSGAIVSPDVQAFMEAQLPAKYPAFQGSLPLYRQHPEKNYWATVIDGGATVYFQYNNCAEDPSQASEEFFVQLEQVLSDAKVKRVIIDLRNNSSDVTSTPDPWIQHIGLWFNQTGRLYVIVGRATFSAAMAQAADLHGRTAAIFVGEPTGAKPGFPLPGGDLALPYFGIRVSYSDSAVTASDPGPALIPDIPAGLTFQDYMNGADPALEAILRIDPSCAPAVITAQPQSQTVPRSTPVTVEVTATGTSPLKYEWFQGGAGDTTQPVGRNSRVLALPAPASPVTTFWVRITNACGMAVSQTSTVTLQVPAQPAFTASDVVNAASLAAGLVPGSLSIVTGAGLSTLTNGAVQAGAIPLPFSLHGTSVIVGGIAAPLQSISNANGVQQILFQAPWELAGRASASVVVMNNEVSSQEADVAVLAAQPGIFPLILHGATLLPVTDANPARPLETVTLYATGLGGVAAWVGTGFPGPQAPRARTTVTPLVTVGERQANVSFAGLAPGSVGVYQIDIVLPADLPAGSVPISITMGGAASNTALMPAGSI